MKILVISPNHTHPITNGTAKFIMDYCELLKDMGNEVYFLHVTYCKRLKSEREKNLREINGTREVWGDHYFNYHTSLINGVCDKVIRVYRKFCNNSYGKCDDHYPSGLDKYVKTINKSYNFDAVIINYFWLSKLFTNCDIPRQAIVTHDSYSFYNLRNSIKMWFNLDPSQEAKALQRCNYIFAMQNDEATVFRYLAPKSRVLVSFCNYKTNLQNPTYNHNLLFFSGGFKMNRFGLKWFMTEIFPSIKKEFPDCRLLIGGTICKMIPEYTDIENVELIGVVDDPADFFKLGDVAINPTYMGAGLKIKTFEAMSYGKTVMVHPHCMNGIYKKENAPIFHSVLASEWVDYLKKIWNNPKLIKENAQLSVDYIESMNEYIRYQFEIFLKEKIGE